jgi:hypothetical protein
LIFTLRPTTGTGAPLAPVPSPLLLLIDSGHTYILCVHTKHPNFGRIVKKPHMNVQPQTRRHIPWLAVLCFLVAALCVYNPFFTIYGVSASLHVHHPLSYRGTIASSELRRCVLDPKLPQASDSVALETWEQIQGVFLQPHSVFSVRPPNDVLPAVRQVVLDGLWFRPPPKS